MKKEEFKAAREVLGEEEVYAQVTLEAEKKAREKAAEEYKERGRRLGITALWWGLLLYATLLTLWNGSLLISRKWAWDTVQVAQANEKKALQVARAELTWERKKLEADQKESEKKIIGWKKWFLTHHFNPEGLPGNFNPVTQTEEGD